MTLSRPLLTNEALVELVSAHEPPCLSLYQPTHRRHPENQQDPIRFGNLVKELEASLRQEYPNAETRLLLEPFQALAHDRDFWTHTKDGLPEHHHLFHRVSHNPFLLAEGLSINPDALPIDELRERAWQVVEPQYQSRLATLADEFAVAKSKGLGSDELAEVAQAAATGLAAIYRY